MPTDHQLARAIAEIAHPLTGTWADFDPIVERIGEARFVLIGESSHGTHEFYKLRAELTKRLIRERGFTAIAAEADWPDAYRVNRYVRGLGADRDAVDCLGDFRRFPQWMWRNADVVDAVGWLRAHNDAIDPAARVGFYGLDLYSLHASIDAVIRYLETADPAAAVAARERYSCFDPFGDEPQHYGYAAAAGADDCADEVVEQLVDLRSRRETLLRADGVAAEDEQFAAEQNARVIQNAEHYYRAMFTGGVSTWNLRDTHMMDTLDALGTHLGRRGAPAKLIVWAHNSHVGDSDAATHRHDRGEITIGHLCRQRHPDSTVLVGFSTHHGTVTAASDWGAPAERRRVRDGLRGSYEALFHLTGVPRFLLMLGDLGEISGALREPRLERAIGVIYRPETERQSHYSRTRLPQQFDAVLHLDETRAIEPLERTATWTRGEVPDTYPSGL
jgi:erythromycin esterase-like protein